jgi:hypothetical protein
VPVPVPVPEALEPLEPVALADVSVLPGEDVVCDAEELVEVVLVALVGAWAPQRLSTRHAVWQVLSLEPHAATHWFPYSVHSKYGIVWE